MSSDPRGRFIRRFAVRTTLRFTLLVAVGTAVAAVGVFLGLRHSLLRETDEILEGDIREFQLHLSDPKWEGELLVSELAREVQGRESQKVFYRLFGPDGRELWTIPQEHAGKLLPSEEDIRHSLAGHRSHLVLPVPGEADCMTLVNPARLPDGRDGVCQVGMSLGQINRRLQKFALVLGAIWLAVVVAGALISYRSTQGPLGQLRTMTARVREISATELHLRLPKNGTNDEFDTLAETLNEMLERLQDAVRRLNQFTADAAHELRSPVARLRMAADVALSGSENSEASQTALQDIIRQADGLTSLVTHLLFLAREGDGHGAANMQDVDAAELLDETASVYTAAADDKGTRIDHSEFEAARVRGDRQRLLQAIGNLVMNAIQYTPPGGTVTLAGAIDGDTYSFTVSDTGCGISETDLPHIFDRFYRADVSRHTAGAGLGLSIVQAIARSHGGAVTVESEPGRGSTFRLTIPLA